MLKGISRIPLKLIVKEGQDNLRERYGGVTGSFVLEGELLKPKNDDRTNTVGIFMHPTAATTMLPLPLALTGLGMHICVASSRYPNNDTLLNVENLILDLGEFVRHLKLKMGYLRVILFGWSGGGALASLYQSQAENPSRILSSINEKQKRLSNLLKADMLILVAAHCGRASYLTEALDPTILLCQRSTSDPDELKKFSIYGDNAVKPPYSKEFLNSYRKLQKERSQRITEYAKTLPPETPLIIEGTMADPRWMDLTIDPNDRPTAGRCFLGECESANNMPTGLSRFTTAGSWLSQWAEGISELDALKHLPFTSIPTLIITNSADDGVPASHGKKMFNSVKHDKKQFVEIAKATHYYIKGNPPRAQKRQLFECASVIVKFIDDNTLIDLNTLQKVYSVQEWDDDYLLNKKEDKNDEYKDNELPYAPKPLGFNHIAAVCSDMSTTIRFYCGILGFKVVKTLELPDGGQHFFLDCGNSNGGTLAFFWWPNKNEKRASGIATASKADMKAGRIPRSYPGSVNHIAFSYPEDGFDALIKRIQAAGIWVSPPVYHADNEIGFASSKDDPSVIAISIYLWGPDGEMIEFSHSTDKMFPKDFKNRILHQPGFNKLSKL